MRRRIQILSFDQVYVAGGNAPPDPDLGSKLGSELPGFLNWVISGIPDYHARGLDPPPVVQEANRQYWEDNDQIGQWLRARTVIAPGNKVLNKNLITSSRDWCKGETVTPLGKGNFGERLKGRGFDAETVKNQYLRVGLRLKTDEEIEAEKEAAQEFEAPFYVENDPLASIRNISY
jgi:phage/plasmid-associated DNA primase